MKSSLYTVLFIAFIDFLGIGIIYPLFSAMLFDRDLMVLPLETSNHIRGLWLGILFSLTPLAQFFSSPLWGAFSDNKGRKKPLQVSLFVALFGYLVALVGVAGSSIVLLCLSRVMIGFSSGNLP